MKIFLSGGCKNGKSYYAQRVAKAAGAPLYYIATMIPHDHEDDARILRHRKERENWGFETIECGRDIQNVLNNADQNGSFLLDSVTALLSNEMFAPEFRPDAAEKVKNDLLALVSQTPNIVLVSDFIGSDAALYDEWTETYRRGLAMIDRALANACDTVIEVVAGQLAFYKGESI